MTSPEFKKLSDHVRHCEKPRDECVPCTAWFAIMRGDADALERLLFWGEAGWTATRSDGNRTTRGGRTVNLLTLNTLWFWRKGEEGPELLVAWPAFDVDQNFEGWQEACRRELDVVSSDMSELGYRYINIRVPYDPIEQAFYPTEIDAEDAAASMDLVEAKEGDR